MQRIRRAWIMPMRYQDEQIAVAGDRGKGDYPLKAIGLSLQSQVKPNRSQSNHVSQ